MSHAGMNPFIGDPDDPVWPPRLQDVANAAGVSLATASRAMSAARQGHTSLYRMRPDTMAAVLDAAQRLDYRPLTVRGPNRTGSADLAQLVHWLARLDPTDPDLPTLAHVIERARATLTAAGMPISEES